MNTAQSASLSMVYPRHDAVSDISTMYPWPESSWIRASMVSTVDGAGTGPDGTSGSISTPADFDLFLALRNDCDVILVGAGTARAERYRPPRVARLAVVTASGHLSADLPFIADARADAPPLILTCASADHTALDALDGRAEVVVCGESSVDLTAAVNALVARELRRVVMEGGPRLLGDLIAEELVDELDLQVTPFLAGGSYVDAEPIRRIVAHTALPHAPVGLDLAHILTDGQTLFLRYQRAAVSVSTRAGQ